MMSPSSIRSWATLIPLFLSSLVPAIRAEESLIVASPVLATPVGTLVGPKPVVSATAADSEVSTAAAEAESYTGWTVSAIEALQTWYNKHEGLWLSTGWWNSANCLTVLGDFYSLDTDAADELDLSEVFSNTFTQAQKTITEARKLLMTRGRGSRIVESRYTKTTVAGKSDLARRWFNGFLNNFYDDEGWWALAWIRAYDVTGEAAYLAVAESIFQDMQGGVNSTCGGGIWWTKDRTAKNAIANELYLAVAASLANRASDPVSYLRIAEGQWAWFRNSGMINSGNLINDGLTIFANGTCVNDKKTIWSYNQGVVLGGLVELYKANGNSSLLSEAVTIAEAAINALSLDGILHESCEDDDCAADGSQFKGIFMRNLHYLQLEVAQNRFRTFLLDNAESIWANDRNSSGYLGLDWAGPPSAGGGPNASTQSSALDALVAAMAVF